VLLNEYFLEATTSLTHGDSAEDLEQTLLRNAALFNHQLPQSALKSKTPM
jgi:hypothetical protein